MKVYIVMIDFNDRRDSEVFGVYTQYRHAMQAKEQANKTLSEIEYDYEQKTRIVGPISVIE